MSTAPASAATETAAPPAPNSTMATTAAALAPHLAPGAPVVLCAKGIEQGSGAMMTEVAAAVLPGARLAVLSGPTFAIEVARARFIEMTALDGEVRTLEERLETRKVVEQAKGRLMADQGLTEAEAFRWIQRTAMNQRTSMKALAQQILAAEATPEGTTA